MYLQSFIIRTFSFLSNLLLINDTPEPISVNILSSPGIDSQPSRIDSSESFPGLLKSLQIRAQLFPVTPYFLICTLPLLKFLFSTYVCSIASSKFYFPCHLQNLAPKYFHLCFQNKNLKLYLDIQYRYTPITKFSPTPGSVTALDLVKNTMKVFFSI